MCHIHIPLTSVFKLSRQTIVNLAEQHGKESVVTHAYRDHVNELALKDVQYVYSLYPTSVHN